MPDFKKHLSLSDLLAMKDSIEDVNYWRKLCPNTPISDFALDGTKAVPIDKAQLIEYQSFLSDKYSYVKLDVNQKSPALLAFLENNMEALKNSIAN